MDKIEQLLELGDANRDEIAEEFGCEAANEDGALKVNQHCRTRRMQAK